MRLDFSGGRLVSRAAAADDLMRFSTQYDGADVEVDLGDNLAMTSWVDGCLVEIARIVAAAQARLIVYATDAETREHIDFVFHRRSLALTVGYTRASVAAGELEVFGEVSMATRQILDILIRSGETSVADLADDLGITVEAAQQRLNGLLGAGLVVRKKNSRAFVYGLIRSSAEQEIAVA